MLNKQMLLVKLSVILLFGILGWILASGSGKAQWVRLLDIFLYGPYLLILAFHKTYVFSEWEQLFLFMLGSTTITYNLRNFLGAL